MHRTVLHSDLEVFHKNCELQGVSPPKNLDLVFKPETKNNDPVVIKRMVKILLFHFIKQNP